MFCRILPGEHPFVQYEACISDAYARGRTLARLIALKNSGAIVPDASVSEERLARIRNGVPLSGLMPIGLAAIISKQRLF